MKINLTELLAILDGALAIAEIVVKWTPTDKDDAALAKIKALREQFRPLFGASAESVAETTIEVSDADAAEIRSLATSLNLQCDGCCNG